MLKDELDLDGRPNLNLASFVGTYMEREAEALMVENLSKNMSDADEYPAMMAMHARCVRLCSPFFSNYEPWNMSWERLVCRHGSRLEIFFPIAKLTPISLLRFPLLPISGVCRKVKPPLGLPRLVLPRQFTLVALP